LACPTCPCESEKEGWGCWGSMLHYTCMYILCVCASARLCVCISRRIQKGSSLPRQAGEPCKTHQYTTPPIPPAPPPPCTTAHLVGQLPFGGRPGRLCSLRHFPSCFRVEHLHSTRVEHSGPLAVRGKRACDGCHAYIHTRVTQPSTNTLILAYTQMQYTSMAC